MVDLFGLPNEIILLCVSALDQSDIFQLLRTCRYAQTILTPTLYAIGYGAALLWAAARNQKQIFARALRYSQPETNVLFKALLAAAQHGHVEIAEQLLDHGAPTELQQEDEQLQASPRLLRGYPPDDSPLVAAIVAGHPAIVSLLLARGARTDVAGQRGYFPLHHASDQHEAPSCVSLLLAAGADVHARNQDGMTAFDLASGDGLYGRRPSSGILRELLLSEGGSMLSLTSNRASIARKLISTGDEDCQRLVLEFGIPRMLPVAPSVVLLAAAAVGDEAIVSELLQRRDLDVERTTDLTGNNAPMLAAKHGHSDVFRRMLPHITGGVHSGRNMDGQTILHLAISSGDLDTVRTVANFVTATPKVFNMRDRSGRTPLLLATECKTEKLEVIRLLIAQGANIEVIDISGSSPLHNAARRGHSETVRLLLATLSGLPHSSSPTTLLKPSARLATIWGSNDRIPDDDELLAMHKKPPQIQRTGMFDFGAPSTAQPTYMQVATRQGPLINLVNDNGFTPLALAEEHRDVANWLIEHGAVALDNAQQLEQNGWFTGLKKAAGYGY
jgi:ankyrin repeat protein